MKSVWILAGLAAITVASPAAAQHLDNLDTPYASLGECQAASNGFSMDVRAGLLAMFPNFFESQGDITSFLIKAFPCELDESDEQWYLQDTRSEVLGSEWYQRRH